MAIKINFIDFWKGFDKNNNIFLDALVSAFGEDTEVIITDKPDYLFYSDFGYGHLKYKCIKIYFTGENLCPDFNLCDYAIGSCELQFGDRYLRLPLYCLYENECKKALNKHIQAETYNRDKGFCACVISNTFADCARKTFIELLDKYKEIASGGKYKNNVGGG